MRCQCYKSDDDAKVDSGKEKTVALELYGHPSVSYVPRMLPR